MSDFKQIVEKASPVLGFLTATVILLGSTITAVTILLPLYIKQGNKIIYPTVIIVIGIIFSWILILFIFKIVSYLDKKEVLKYFFYKLREFVTLATAKQSIDLPPLIKYDCSMFYSYLKNRLDVIQDFACINQGEIAQFYFLAGNEHKKLKKLIKDKCRDKVKIENQCKELRDVIYVMMTGNKKVFDKCCIKINEYYSGRNKIAPRICIKIQEDEGISDFYRFGSERKNKVSEFDDNTAHKKISETGKYYLCNNIPEYVGREDYYNRRLDGEGVRKHQRIHGEINDYATWRRFWKPYESGEENNNVSPDSCYMSTLVTPMTLFDNTDLDEKFRKKFVGDEKQAYTDEEKQRFIYGFLCLDHTEKDYFNEELDYRVNYIFTDLLSVYLIAYYMYTDYSDTFIDAQKLIHTGC
jgi:hypothetical protein